MAALALTPGFLRSEQVLESLKVTEANWRDAIPGRPEFAESETPHFVGRAVAALAADPKVMKKSGRVFNSYELSREYGFVDADGRVPNVWEPIARMFRFKKIDDVFYSYVDMDYDLVDRELKKIQKEKNAAEKRAAQTLS